MNRATSLSLPTMLVVLSLVRAVSADVFHVPPRLTSLETVVVGDLDNPPDDTGYGAW
jgi:hypothetical protein